jgi:hypothetical protein
MQPLNLDNEGVRETKNPRTDARERPAFSASFPRRHGSLMTRVTRVSRTASPDTTALVGPNPMPILRREIKSRIAAGLNLR